MLLARGRTGSSVYMDGSHNPRPSEILAAQRFVRDFLDPLVAECRDLRERLEQIRQLHVKAPLYDVCEDAECEARWETTVGDWVCGEPINHVCEQCAYDDGTPVDWPCATAAILDGTT